MREILFLCCSFLFINCTAPKKYIDLTSHPLKAKNIRLDIKSLESWQHKDIIEDTIPGISLDKAYRELLKKRKRQSVIVAVIDEEIDIHNVDFKKSIWTNVKEIEGNGIDDDGNGYVDDIHGWNFIGNQKGENIIYANMESIRIVRKLKPKIENNTTAHVSDTEKILYQKALLEYENLKKNRKSDKEYIEAVADAFIKGKEIIKDFFPNNEYDVKKIDSILLAYPNDTERNYYVSYFKQCLENKVTEKWIANYKKNVEEMTNKCINIDYNDRLIPGDNPYDIKDSNYGNNNVSANVDVLEHGTTVVGILSSERNNGVGINGISNYLKIMPLSIASYGNENDKDIALAIRYAVDNGAKVINMSFGKLLSMNENWVLDAIRYAADNDVLIISSAGNGGNEVNSEKPYYPNDGNYFDNEVSDNFMKVGSISYNLNEKLISSFSNYSDSHVDLFAPGEKIYTTLPDNQYDFVNGTSYSTPIVSGVAALLRSYYPNLSASEVKHILMDSGLSIPINVQVPGAPEGTLKAFGELSKSGKVVNAYNALLMAKEVAKKKKKKRA